MDIEPNHPDNDGQIKTIYGRVKWGLYTIDSDKMYYIIYDLYINKEFRHKGFAKALLQAASNIISVENVNKHPIGIMPKPMEDSITIEDLTRFYRKMGFDIVSY